jgi:hypothetical protein
MSRALFARRLKDLVERGLVERRQRDGAAAVYQLAPPGRELEPVLEALGIWGQRWIREIRDEDIDVGYLLWNMRRRIHLDRLPPGRTVVQFDFKGTRRRSESYWLVLLRNKVDLCVDDPGFGVDLVVETDPRSMIEIWRGLVPFSQVIREGRLQMQGARKLRSAFPTWLMLSHFAHVASPR